eukprot:5161762-Prymnesium_polylepis.2
MAPDVPTLHSASLVPLSDRPATNTLRAAPVVSLTTCAVDTQVTVPRHLCSPTSRMASSALSFASGTIARRSFAKMHRRTGGTDWRPRRACTPAGKEGSPGRAWHSEVFARHGPRVDSGSLSVDNESPVLVTTRAGSMALSGGAKRRRARHALLMKKLHSSHRKCTENGFSAKRPGGGLPTVRQVRQMIDTTGHAQERTVPHRDRPAHIP